MQVTIDNFIPEVIADIHSRFDNQIKFSASQALNKAAYLLSKSVLPAHTEGVFDKGSTRWTKGAFEYRKSSKGRLVALVSTKERNAYLALQIFGGTLKPEGGALLKKTMNTRLTKQGNVSRKQRTSLLRKAHTTKGYFVGKPKGKGMEAYPFAIYKRSNYKRKGNKLTAQVYYDKKPTKYNARFKFHKVSEVEFNLMFPKLFRDAMVKNILSDRLNAHLIMS